MTRRANYRNYTQIHYANEPSFFSEINWWICGKLVQNDMTWGEWMKNDFFIRQYNRRPRAFICCGQLEKFGWDFDCLLLLERSELRPRAHDKFITRIIRPTGCMLIIIQKLFPWQMNGRKWETRHFIQSATPWQRTHEFRRIWRSIKIWSIHVRLSNDLDQGRHLFTKIFCFSKLMKAPPEAEDW